MRHALASLAILAALALGTSSTFAARQPAPPFHVYHFDQQQPVEQQTPMGATQPDQSLWVINPTDCLWDADDNISASAAGRFDRGASVTFTVCIVGDWTPHLVWIAASEGLATSISASNGPTAPRCLYGPDYNHEYGGFAPIEGSHGGVGVVHVLTLTATNVTGHPVKAAVRVGSTLATTQALDTYCPGRVRLPGYDPTWWAG